MAEAGMLTKMVLVSPQLAAQWLEMNAGNRPINKAQVVYFKRVIRAGNWRITHQGAAFYDDGFLADGQHRLSAIADGEVSVYMNVTWGLARSSVHAIDRGRNRSVQNVFGFIGLEMTSPQVAACRNMWIEYHSARSLDAEMNAALDTKRLAVFAQHVLPSLEFATPKSMAKGVAHAAVTGAIASAWFTQDRDLLERFKHLLHSGVGADESESAAVRLREFLLTTKLNSGSAARKELFLRTCTALRAFLEGRGVTRLYCRPDAVFAIPDCPGL